tara:strand:- start:1765 stop:2475 length:711 start_codon:yes stop_codon:yes gene_type:complete
MVIKKKESPRRIINNALTNEFWFINFLKSKNLEVLIENNKLNLQGQYCMKQFRNCLQSIVSQVGYEETYTIVGYGSLLKESDAYRTMPDMKNHRLGYIDKFRRIFNMWGYLNVEVDLDVKNMPVGIAELNTSDVISFAFRERNYFVQKIPFTEIDESTSSGLMVIANEENQTTQGEPIITYLLLCMTGVRELGGYKALNKFIETTFTNQGPLLHYLQEYNLTGLIQYVTRNSHIKR